MPEVNKLIMMSFIPRLGFPEVELGILPAASGTQRFPRLVGLASALELIPTGTRFKADHALKIGVVDKVGYIANSIVESVMTSSIFM